MVTHRVKTIHSGHSQRCVELWWLSGRTVPDAGSYPFRGISVFLFYFSLSLRFSTYSIKSHEKLWNCRSWVFRELG